MKLFKFTAALLFAMLFNNLQAQDMKFGKVSKAELEEKFNPLDSAAAATYLFKKRRTYFEYQTGEGFYLMTSVHNRIKLYNKTGFDYATKELVLYKNGSDREKVTSLKAVTYNLKDGKIEESKLKKDGQFTVELSEYRDQKSFTMPNINEGSVIEFEYKIRSPFISNVDEFVFQHAIPVKYLEATMDAPEYFNFRFNARGFLMVNPEKERKNRTLRVQQNSASRAGQGYKNSGTVAGQGSTIKYQADISNYKLENVPALKEEPYVNRINNYRSAVSYELAFTDFPNSPRKTYATDWGSVVKTIYENSNFGDELNRTNYFEDDITALISSVKDDEEKISTIFNLVKSKVKWNERYGKFTRDGVKKAYKEGKGNIAEINLMLTAMLRYAGLDANPVLVSTRSNGIPLFPTRDGYNYVVSCVQLAKGMVLLDASDEYSSPNVLPFRTLNWEGRIIKNDGTSKTISLYPSKSSLKRVFVNANLSNVGAIDGKIKLSYSGHNAVSFRRSYYKTNEDGYLDELENDFANLEIENFEVKHAENLSKPPTVSYDFVVENDNEVIADKLYFTPMTFLKTTKNPFTLEQRQFPIDFGYPSSESIAANIVLPAGYKVESMPESMSLALPEGLGIFKFILSNENNKLQLNTTTKINHAVIPPVYYDALKEYYKKMIEKMNEKVVLSKV